MKMQKKWFIMLPYYFIIPTLLILAILYTDKAVTTIAEGRGIPTQSIIVIDAGHGGVDGGASTASGVLESHINLDIANRLNDLLHLMGIQTKMIRTEDISVYTAGNTIAAKKISDLKERVRIVNTTPSALLISIHQNHFSDHRYDGAQVFYGKDEYSEKLAFSLQTQLNASLCSNANRKSKKASGIYLMEHVTRPAILVECGFLSNYNESLLLQTPDYQKKLCMVMAATVSSFLSNT